LVKTVGELLWLMDEERIAECWLDTDNSVTLHVSLTGEYACKSDGIAVVRSKIVQAAGSRDFRTSAPRHYR